MYDLFQKKKSLMSLTTLGIGGPARYFLEVRSVVQMQEVIAFCIQEGLEYLILGKGSNCLISDTGFDGVVILNKIEFCHDKGCGLFHVGAGTSFSWLGIHTAKQGWSGLEFASGIPATIGGAVFMNAGANGGEVANVLVSVDYIDEASCFLSLDKDVLDFSYRKSPFQKRKGVIVGAHFQLTQGEEARQKQMQIVDYRIKTQPYKEMSAGCIFRNPSCASAGYLIEQCGLKGFCIGGAQVSKKHANFLINTGHSTAYDMLRLIDHVKNTVFEHKGIELEVEVRLIGDIKASICVKEPHECNTKK